MEKLVESINYLTTCLLCLVNLFAFDFFLIKAVHHSSWFELSYSSGFVGIWVLIRLLGLV